jgi:hypothetical protein
MSPRTRRAFGGRPYKQRFYRPAAERSSDRAPSVASQRFGSAIRVIRWHHIAKPGRVFSMMIAEVLAVGRWRTAHSFSPPNRLTPRFGVRRRIFDDESHHPIDLGERFLRRRVSGYLDPLLTADLFRPFLERFVLITIAATCHSLPECIWSCRRGSTSGASAFFRSMVAAREPPMARTGICLSHRRHYRWIL